MASKPLAVAVVASVLLVGLLAADAAMNRQFELQQRVDGGWVTVAREPRLDAADEPFSRGEFPRSVGFNETVRFRLLVENTYAWGFEERYRVFANGIEVADGVVSAPARGTGEVGFSVPANVTAESGRGAPTPSPETSTRHLQIEIVIDGTRLWTGLDVQGGPA